MRIAVFSDVHGNLPALERFVESTRTDVDRYVCLGDTVNYGPWNDECLAMTAALPGIISLEGNHERLFRGESPITDEHPLVQEFWALSIANFTRWDLIRELPTTWDLDDVRFAHTIGDRRIYADTAVEVDRHWFIGHTHHQFSVERSGKRVVNCGSVGQNRAIAGSIDYAVFDTDTSAVSLHREPYPFQSFVNELIARGYPSRCVDYYLKRARAQS